MAEIVITLSLWPSRAWCTLKHVNQQIMFVTCPGRALDLTSGTEIAAHARAERSKPLAYTKIRALTPVGALSSSPCRAQDSVQGQSPRRDAAR
jgi:hypothetical protein